MPYKRSKTDIHSLPDLIEYRTELRAALTPAEATLWTMLKNSQLDGRKFRRQHSVGRYILDFYCASEKLAVELDGAGHFTGAAREYDRERQHYLEENGIDVIRFENKRVFDEPEWVLDVIRSKFAVVERTNPSPEAGATPPS